MDECCPFVLWQFYNFVPFAIIKQVARRCVIVAVKDGKFPKMLCEVNSGLEAMQGIILWNSTVAIWKINLS